MASIPDLLRFRETKFHPEIQKFVASAERLIKDINISIPNLPAKFSAETFGDILRDAIIEKKLKEKGAIELMDPQHNPLERTNIPNPVVEGGRFRLNSAKLAELFEKNSGFQNYRLKEIFDSFLAKAGPKKAKDIGGELESLITGLHEFMRGYQQN